MAIGKLFFLFEPKVLDRTALQEMKKTQHEKEERNSCYPRQNIRCYVNIGSPDIRRLETILSYS